MTGQNGPSPLVYDVHVSTTLFFIGCLDQDDAGSDTIDNGFVKTMLDLPTKHATA